MMDWPASTSIKSHPCSLSILGSHSVFRLQTSPRVGSGPEDRYAGGFPSGHRAATSKTSTGISCGLPTSLPAYPSRGEG